MTVIEWARPGDEGEILTVQRAAYVSEAQLYGDPFIPPLVESAAQVRAAVETGTVLVARERARIVGAVRGRVSDAACLVGRLVVAPDMQGGGIGGALLAALHEEVAAPVFDLFTGHLSEAGLRLYRRLGYREAGRERMSDHLTLVHMRRERPAGS
ncbi:GNAT superfamily N-acetyltransferase [Streptosporangium becharense]|uniref:GNAT superfamily N-acetyltransferase n=1 Tax=Streptosporangium becharense TaxID=1816182 RepID=A0A7W9MF77_9ACTN|nr:GNAT family N-acetyltransferase [Streptosporangium becharense]MBB2912944.1 GNAT superfamily N-acetyltransferase [Streptosporangium becharense]MBB5818231.1 GNAT superfamily N-acetyltransferase [Streptosporangium becharense]